MKVNTDLIQSLASSGKGDSVSIPDIYVFQVSGMKVATMGYAIDQVIQNPSKEAWVTLPCTKPWLLGVMKFKNQPVPLIDLASYCGLKTKNTNEQRVLIYSTIESGYIGFIVDGDIEFVTSKDLTGSDEKVKVPAVMKESVLSVVDIDMEPTPLICMDRFVSSTHFNFKQESA